MKPYLHFLTKGTISASEIQSVMEIGYPQSKKVINELLKNNLIEACEDVVGRYKIITENMQKFKEIFEEGTKKKGPKKLTDEYFAECENFLVDAINNSYPKFICFACGTLGSWGREKHFEEIKYDFTEFGNYMEVSIRSPLFYTLTENMHRYICLKSDMDQIGMFNFPEQAISYFAETLNSIRFSDSFKDKVDCFKYAYQLSDEVLGLESVTNLRNIIVAYIEVNKDDFSYSDIEFYDTRNDQPILFNVRYKDKVKYIISVKKKEDGNVNVLRIFESDWQMPICEDVPKNLNNLKDLYQIIINKITNQNIDITELEMYQPVIPSRKDNLLKNVKQALKKHGFSVTDVKQNNYVDFTIKAYDRKIAVYCNVMYNRLTKEFIKNIRTESEKIRARGVMLFTDQECSEEILEEAYYQAVNIYFKPEIYRLTHDIIFDYIKPRQINKDSEDEEY